MEERNEEMGRGSGEWGKEGETGRKEEMEGGNWKRGVGRKEKWRM